MQRVFVVPFVMDDEIVAAVVKVDEMMDMDDIVSQVQVSVVDGFEPILLDYFDYLHRVDDVLLRLHRRRRQRPVESVVDNSLDLRIAQVVNYSDTSSAFAGHCSAVAVAVVAEDLVA